VTSYLATLKLIFQTVELAILEDFLPSLTHLTTETHETMFNFKRLLIHLKWKKSVWIAYKVLTLQKLTRGILNLFSPKRIFRMRRKLAFEDCLVTCRGLFLRPFFHSWERFSKSFWKWMYGTNLTKLILMRIFVSYRLTTPRQYSLLSRYIGR
jgi:hypothetical protein